MRESTPTVRAHGKTAPIHDRGGRPSVLHQHRKGIVDIDEFAGGCSGDAIREFHGVSLRSGRQGAAPKFASKQLPRRRAGIAMLVDAMGQSPPEGGSRRGATRLAGMTGRGPSPLASVSEAAPPITPGAGRASGLFKRDEAGDEIEVIEISSPGSRPRRRHGEG